MNTPQKILIVESDVQAARAMHDHLKMTFPDVRVVFDTMAVSKEFYAFSPDFIVANRATFINPDPSVFCREIRKVTEVPILLYGSNIPSGQKVRAFEAGADDILEKPLDMRELTARIRAIWRRYLAKPPTATPKKEAPKTIAYPGLFISLTNYTVVCDGKPVLMPPKELELFYFLAKAPNRVFTREQLLDRIWGYDYVGDARTVDVHIKRIREKIKNHASWSLDTVWGVGYKFSAASTHTSSDDPPSPSDQNGSA